VSQILIADDDTTVRTTLKALLETHADWHVCGEAKNGIEAVERAAELNPDVIILDLAMPGINGLQAASQIHSRSADVPILIYTNYAFTPQATLDAKKSGVRQIIEKGASPDQLMRAVETLLNKQARNAAAATLDAISIQRADPEGDPQRK
jgi:DNA-binding NarL/FixJ family response regulator